MIRRTWSALWKFEQGVSMPPKSSHDLFVSWCPHLSSTTTHTNLAHSSPTHSSLAYSSLAHSSLVHRSPATNSIVKRPWRRRKSLKRLCRLLGLLSLLINKLWHCDWWMFTFGIFTFICRHLEYSCVYGVCRHIL